MTSTFLILTCGSAGFLLLLMLYLFVRAEKTRFSGDLDVGCEPTRSHVTYLPVIRQALSAQDLTFLESRADAPAVRRTHKERQQIAILYLVELRSDFRKLLRLARIISVMSPEVAASHELERLQLTFMFTVRYGLVVAGLHLGWLLMPQLGRLIRMVSELAFRMESSIKALGEGAMVAMELASTLNRRSLDVA